MNDKKSLQEEYSILNRMWKSVDESQAEAIKLDLSCARHKKVIQARLDEIEELMALDDGSYSELSEACEVPCESDDTCEHSHGTLDCEICVLEANRGRHIDLDVDNHLENPY